MTTRHLASLRASLSVSLFTVVALTACAKKPAADKQPPAPGHIAIQVTEDGFAPASINVPSGKPVVLEFKRITDVTCAKQVVIEQGDGTKIEKELPLGKTVEIATTFAKAGELKYACAMDMVTGTIHVQ